MLSRRTDSSGARAAALALLERAWRAFDQGTHRRPRALCAGSLARLSLDCGNAAAAIRWTRAAVEELPSLRSARLVRQLKAVRAAARAKPADAELAELAAGIDHALDPGDHDDAAG